MRALRLILLAVLVVVIVAGVAWRLARQPRANPAWLSDGSQVVLLKVTQGTNHVCRFGWRWQDVLYPVLPPKLRAQFRPRVTSLTTSPDGVVVWLSRISLPAQASPARYFVSVLDEFGLESKPIQSANVTLTVNPGNKGLSGWELREFPRRAKRFKVRVYESMPGGQPLHVADFEFVNHAPQNKPGWPAELLPGARETNGLKFTLTGLETGLTTKDTGIGPAGKDAKAFSRATFTVEENGVPTENWGVCRIAARNAAGESRDGGSYGSGWRKGVHTVSFSGGLWLEEPAWRLSVSFARTGRFPAEELWSIKNLAVPGERELIPTRVVTNKFGEELEFLGVSRAHASLPEGYTGMSSEANIHLRTAYPLDELRVVLVEVTDDRGRKLMTRGHSNTTSTGGRGITPKEMLYGFGLEIPDHVKTLDVTLAATKIVTVEFQVKPALTQPPRGN